MKVAGWFANGTAVNRGPVILVRVTTEAYEGGSLRGADGPRVAGAGDCAGMYLKLPSKSGCKP